MNKTVYQLLFCLLMNNLSAQEISYSPPIEVRQFEYIYEKDVSNSPKIILLQQDSVQALLKKSFIDAINQKWHQQLSDMPLVVKKLSNSSTSPKFKPKVENKDAAKRYLFLQIFDINQLSMPSVENSRTAKWRIKCRMIDGKNNADIINRDFAIDFFRKIPPAGQLIITSFHGYPEDFYKTFDSIANWSLNDSLNTEYTIKLRQACIYNTEDRPTLPALKTLSFKNEQNQTIHEGNPSFTLVQQSVNAIQNKTKRNIAGNSAAGAVTLLTGLGSNKRKKINYTADYIIADNDQQYHCYLYYTEVEETERERTRNDDGSVSMQRGEFTFIGRYTDKADRQIILKGNDTIAWFNIQYYKEQKNYTRMWDGEDSSTISPLPFEWKNTFKDDEVLLNGVIEGIPFTMYTTNATRKKWFTLNNQLAVLLNGYGKPVSGALYQSLSEQQFKIITILSGLPYSYLNIGAGDL